MKSHYFCAFHTRNIQTNETEAMSRWISLMRRGAKAFSECRVDGAKVYFEAALDIALLRIEQPVNHFFTLTQLLKPTDFLMDLYMADESFNEAYNTLHKISDQLSVCPTYMDRTPQEILQPYYHGLAGLEKELTSLAWHTPLAPNQGSIPVKREVNQTLFRPMTLHDTNEAVVH